MILGTRSRYAVMALVELAGHQLHEPVRLAQLAQAQEITVPYLEQIFSKLKQAGLVRSMRGPGGGYVLSRPADAISVGEVIAAVEEPIRMTRCALEEKGLHHKDGCMSTRARCLTHDLWEGLERHIYAYLSTVSLADIRQRNLPQMPSMNKSPAVQGAVQGAVPGSNTGAGGLTG